MAASTPGSNNSVSTIWMVSGWLRESGMFQVSCFAVQCFADVYTLDLDVYRRNLDAAASTHGSNDPIQMFRVVPRWLRNSGVSQVSVSVCFRPINVSRYDFDSTALTPGSNDPMETFRRISRWLRGPGTF